MCGSADVDSVTFKSNAANSAGVRVAHLDIDNLNVVACEDLCGSTEELPTAVGFCQRAVDVADRACVSSHPPLLRHPICKEPRKEWATSVSAFGNARNSNVVGLSDRERI